MRFHHRRRIGQQHRHRVVLANAQPLQAAGELAAARVGLCPGLAQAAVHDGKPVWVDLGTSFQKAEWRERSEIGRGARQMLVEYGCHGTPWESW